MYKKVTHSKIDEAVANMKIEEKPEKSWTPPPEWNYRGRVEPPVRKSFNAPAQATYDPLLEDKDIDKADEL